MGMGIAALGNWLFNFALGLYIPPGFQNIKWGMPIIFGVMCVLGAIQFYFAYPETCNKSLEEIKEIEEIEEIFSHGGPRPWQTKPGESRLDRLVDVAREKHYTVDSFRQKTGSIDDGTHVEVAEDKGL